MEPPGLISRAGTGSYSHSEHRVGVLRFFRHALEHVPVLDDFPVLVEAEDIDPGPDVRMLRPAASARRRQRPLLPITRPLLAAMQDNVLALRDGADEVDLLPRVLL